MTTDPAQTGSRGNASNPDPLPGDSIPSQQKSLLDEKAETYIREGGVIEDMPDPREVQEAADSMEEDQGQ